MNLKIKEIIDFTRTKFGLDNYYLQTHNLYRTVNIFKDTIYTLCMEWFPNHETVQEEEDLNPDGTAVIEVNLETCLVESAIFVMGKTYAKDGITFANQTTSDIIKWIERETELTYGRQFILHREEEGELHFKGCYEGVAVSPSGYIEIKYNKEGKLTSFSVNGPFPSKEKVKEDTYSLSLTMVEDLIKKQLKLIEFPSYEEEKLLPTYAVEEIYVLNDGKSTIPFEMIVDVRSYLKIDKIIDWKESINEQFERKEISWIEDVTEEQAFSSEPSPDSLPITKGEQDKCVRAVTDLLHQEFPNDSGIWKLKTLHREKGYIHAILRASKQDNRVFQRKLVIMIEGDNLQAINYMDNLPMLDVFDKFQAPEKATITKEEAYEKIKELFVLEPYYVYDFEQKQYLLCGKFDCNYGVNAVNGEVISLDDL